MAKKSLLPKDQRGPHVRVYWELIDSNAWRCLTATDQRIYLALARAMTSTNNGDLSLPFTRAKPFGITSKTTLAKSLRALVAVGLVAVTRSGGCTRDGQRQPTLYRLTEYRCFEVPKKLIDASPATNEWKSVTSLGNGRERIRQAEQQAAEKHSKKLKIQVHKLNLTSPENGPVEPLIGPNSGLWPLFHGPKNGQGEKSESDRKANNGAGFPKNPAADCLDGHGPENGLLCIDAIHTPHSGARKVSTTCHAHTLFGRLLHHRLASRMSNHERWPDHIKAGLMETVS